MHWKNNLNDDDFKTQELKLFSYAQMNFTVELHVVISRHSLNGFSDFVFVWN